MKKIKDIAAKLNISEDDLILFVSNRPGGKGGLDIWGYLNYNGNTEIVEPIFSTSINTTTLSVVKNSSYIQIVNNKLYRLPTNLRISEDADYYYLFSDSISSFPSHLQINYRINELKGDQSYQLIIQANGLQLISKNISQKDTSFILPVQELFKNQNIPDKVELISYFKIDDNEKKIINEVEVFNTNKEFLETFEIDNIKYKLIVVPLPQEINDEELGKSLKFLKQEVKYKNGKIIIESSPTFQLYDNEKIRTFLNKLNINNNAIIYQHKVNKNLSKYFNNLNGPPAFPAAKGSDTIPRHLRKMLHQFNTGRTEGKGKRKTSGNSPITWEKTVIH